MLSGGTSLKDFKLSDVNLSCQPPDLVSVNVPGTTLAREPVTIKLDGTFVIDFSQSGVIEGTSFTQTVKVTGNFSGTTASGKFEENLLRRPRLHRDLVHGAERHLDGVAPAVTRAQAGRGRTRGSASGWR